MSQRKREEPFSKGNKEGEKHQQERTPFPQESLPLFLFTKFNYKPREQSLRVYKLPILAPGATAGLGTAQVPVHLETAVRRLLPQHPTVHGNETPEVTFPDCVVGEGRPATGVTKAPGGSV